MITKPSVYPMELKLKKRDCLSHLQKKYKFILFGTFIIIVCLMFSIQNAKYFQIYLLLNEINQPQSFKITNIYYRNAEPAYLFPPYNDDVLVEWEPAPKSPHNASEPGYLG